MKRCMLLLAVLLTLTACENTVEPVVEDADVRFAVYGFLDMRTDRQVVRVESLRPTILAEGGSLEGVLVTAVEEGTGTRHVFRDSVATDAEGSSVSLFVASFLPKAGRAYRLEVARPGEPATLARTVLPEMPLLQFEPAAGTEATLAQTLYLIGVNGAPEATTVYYTVVPPGGEEPVTIPVNYGRLSTGPVSDLNFPVHFFSDRYIVMDALGLDVDVPGVRLLKLELSFDLPSTEWSQVQPRNIERGHGFFASVGRYRYTWLLDRPSVQTLGWIDIQHRE